MSLFLKLILIFGLLFAVTVAACLALVVYIGVNGPGTTVLPGRQVPARFLSQIRDLGLLDEGEQIEFFYSDAILNIENGLYLLTDRKVVVYSSYFEKPDIIVPFEDIADLSTAYSDSFFTDSLVYITLHDGTIVTVPLSSEGGGDKRFVAALRAKLGLDPEETAEDSADSESTGESPPDEAPPAEDR